MHLVKKERQDLNLALPDFQARVLVISINARACVRARASVCAYDYADQQEENMEQ